MQNILTIALILSIAGSLYYGYIFVLQKSMRASQGNSLPKLESPLVPDDPAAQQREQKMKAEETWERQRRMMEDQKQRNRDLLRR